MSENERRIIIVGASSGIGKEMACQLAASGNKLGITGRRIELLEQVRTSFPGNILTACFDITKDKNIEQLESLVQQLNGLDWLVISAGTGEISETLSMEIDH